jgi:hypothetical protein
MRKEGRETTVYVDLHARPAVSHSPFSPRTPTRIFTQEKTKWIHRWFGRAINLWAFFVAFTGYELANDSDDWDEDSTTIAILFGFWYLLKFGYVSLSLYERVFLLGFPLACFY